VSGEAFGKAKLFDVERLGFGDGADDRMKGLAFGDRVDAVDAVGELYEFVAGRWL
jgi:hypothetical protein